MKTSRSISVGAASVNQTPLDFHGNVKNLQEAILEAKRLGVQVLITPELAITGYGCEDAFSFPYVPERALECLGELIPETNQIAVGFGLPLLFDGKLYNVAAFASEGKLLGFVAKRYLAGAGSLVDNGVYYEPRWFTPWPAGEVRTVTTSLGDFPVGDIVFNLDGVRVGFEICEDAWVKPRRGEGLRQFDLDILLNPSASHYAPSKGKRRIEVVRSGTAGIARCSAYANHLGNEAGRILYDGDTYVAIDSDRCAEGARFGFGRFSLSAEVVSLPIREGTHATRVVSGTLPKSVPGSRIHLREKWEDSEELEFEEFTRAAALGLYDSMRKSRSNGFVVSVSGGVDSSACMLLCSIALRFAWSTLGRDGIERRLSYIPGIDRIRNGDELVRSLLLGVYQGSAQSSSLTEEAAREVTHDIGAQYLNFDIQSLVNGYEKLVTDQEGKAGLPLELTWEEHDLVRQNIQSRVRSPGIWLVANLRNALLITTSNRSEASVGYSTMDGDTSGGVAPLAGVDKDFLRRWLKWMESPGPLGVGPFPVLRHVNALQPTAELRPADARQLDETDLMPYDLLQEIESLFLYQRLSPELVVERFSKNHPERSDCEALCEKFFRLFRQSQWKRERYAPGYHLGAYSVDPKGWLRWPILSGEILRR